MGNNKSQLPDVAAAVIVDNLNSPQYLLATQRSEPVEVAGQWEFPGGKVEEGETFHQAISRELQEELGLQVEFGSELTPPDDTLWTTSGGHIIRLFFVQPRKQSVPRIQETQQDMRWIRLWDSGTVNQEFLELPWLQADLPIVDHLAKNFCAAQH